MSIVLLEAKGVCKRFGGLQALTSVSLTINKGEIYGLIGPNGAGKTTFFNVLTGAYIPEEGEFVFNGTELPAGKPHEIVARGIARTFQNIRLFREMTALENVMAGHHIRSSSSVWGIVTRSKHNREEERLITERAYEMLKYVGIERFATTVSKNLSYGDQRRLEIARALATEPQLLALDEPGRRHERDGNRATARVESNASANDGISVLLIEHDVEAGDGPVRSRRRARLRQEDR